ncbi:probable LRR receptor-like serine/threonine-protein kinase At1g51880 [Argentina anserina]|uniref:probable LRR receptor-like serine/threonine-protein kinase At1g51880 n=1 Tax=Argentina anserina TaxID=57926 RepID=UPI0021762E3A|nr:probable LRR receptor-like serine/threonine-protein kinase At1g51880 [Potentilla anserina]
MVLVHAQDQTGFIIIDCGRAENSTYSEKTTTIDYISDATFIDTGERKLVLPENRNDYQQPYWTLRSFPQGTRNCYKINVKSGTRYLIRASFYYGNYDGLDKLPEFELHLGPNLWESVSLDDATTLKTKELIHYVPAKRNYMHVCVVKTGSGVPFVSAIELRPVPYSTYQTQTGSLALYNRFDTGQLAPNLTGYRYPKDTYDRFWRSYSRDDWAQLRTSSIIDPNSYEPASVVMRTAAIPKLATDDLSFYWLQPEDDKNAEFYIYMHFAEVEELPANQSRQLEITRNGDHFYGPFAPDYLETSSIFSTTAMSGPYNFIVKKGAGNSDLQPILNAVEIYTVKEFSEQETNQDDVNAITNIKVAYKIEKNWQGDPCLPKNYSWEGLKCSYSPDDSPRIIYLDLSSSRLTGEIDGSISALTMIQTLNLSNNNLTGPIPDFFSNMSNLNVLNLENNKLTGSVPNGLTERVQNGLLSLSLCNNPNLSENVSCKKKKSAVSGYVIPIIGSVIGITVLLLIVAIIFWRLKRRRQHGAVIEAQSPNGLVELEPTRRQFTYPEILKVTNNRQRILGKGGFGTVYHGYLDDNTQVAVKLLSPSSSRGLEQFHAEVNLLMRVHHTNLTSLVGYCDDEKNKGLVYEYMARGNLQEYLSDKSPNVLTWDGRLHIATDAAQGLEYLHYGCKPPMIHRDVKTTNILLSENFQAKLSDFGLSRNFPAEYGTHIVTGVAGTPGYLAPEYQQLNRFNEKSDVFSFGIVLLEIITGRPAVSRTRERIVINDWVGSVIPKGDIDAIVDPRLNGIFNVNSAWKLVETAMACVSAEANKRPNMSKVVGELKQCLKKQMSQRDQNSYESELGNEFEVVSQNGYSITMLRPSVR